MIIIFLSFLLLWLFSIRLKEGFSFWQSIGKYDYLKPPPGPAVLSEELENKFLEAFNKNVTDMDKTNLTNFKSFFTVEEAEYYVKHNKWPYGSALLYCLKKKEDVLEKLPLKTVRDIQKAWPTRLAFSAICNGECLKDSTLECDIYSGKHIPSKEDK